MTGVRQQINENKKLGIGVGVAIVILALGLIALQFRGPTNASAAVATKAFYTDDDGKTFFKDNADRLVPFDRNGKQAYRADVFRGSDGKEFVGLIYRYTDSGRKEMEAYLPGRSKDEDGSTRRGIEQRGMQVKRPGADDNGWVLNDDVTTERLQATTKDAAGKPATLLTP
jgi:hypothetical protein